MNVYLEYILYIWFLGIFLSLMHTLIILTCFFLLLPANFLTTAAIRLKAFWLDCAPWRFRVSGHAATPTLSGQSINF